MRNKSNKQSPSFYWRQGFSVALIVLLCFLVACDEMIDTIPPTITGASDTTVVAGSDFDPLKGISAKDVEDGDITDQITVTGDVDTTIPGIYTLTYRVTNSRGDSSEVVRNITVTNETDTTPPVFSGLVDCVITIGADFDIRAGVSAVDDRDGTLTDKIIIGGTVDTTKPGTYTLTYLVSDTSGNSAQVSRMITVKAEDVDALVIALDYDITGDGQNDTLVMTKRSIRGPNYRVRTYDSKTREFTTVSTPKVRTYRGYVKDDPDLRVNGSVEPDNTFRGFTSDGKNIIHRIVVPMGGSVNLGKEPGPALTVLPDQPDQLDPLVPSDRISPTSAGQIIPKWTMRKMAVGVSIAPSYFQAHGSVEAAVARAEQRFNDADHFYARDMGIAWELQEIVINVSDSDDVKWENWKKYWSHSNPESPYVKERIQLKAPNGGGSAGRIWTSSNPDGLTHSCTLGDDSAAFARSAGHEVGHGMAAGHGMGVKDHMAGSKSSIATKTVQRQIAISHLASAKSAPLVRYNSPLCPYTMWDYGRTTPGGSIEIDLLENDYDGNGDDIYLEYVDSVTEKGGTVSVVDDGVVRYTAPFGFVGDDYFTYHCEDSTGLSNRNGRVKVKVSSNGLSSHYPFDETSGMTAADLGELNESASGFEMSGNSIKGSVGNALLSPDYASGEKGQFFSKMSGDPMHGSLSVSVWTRFLTLGSKDSLIVCKGGAAIAGREDNPHSGWVIYATKDGAFHFIGNTHAMYDADHPDNEFFDRITESDVIKTGVWNHLVMVIDRDSSEIRAYVNGQPVSRSLYGAIVPETVIESHMKLRIFPFSDSGSRFAIDDLRIYDRILTRQEIKDLYDRLVSIPAGAPVPEDHGSGIPGQVLSWTPGESGRLEFDLYLGNDYDGVHTATHSSPEYMGRLAVTSFKSDGVPGKPYFWRVDQVNGNEITPGPVWAFNINPSVLYDPPVANASFEDQVVMTKDHKNHIMGWHDSGARTARTMWEGATSVPETEFGDNWAQLRSNSWIYQQIGFWAPEKHFELTFLAGKRTDAKALDVEVSLWAGGDPNAAKDEQSLSAIGARQTGTENVVETSTLSPGETSEETVRLKTGSSGFKTGAPLWLKFQTSDERGSLLIDNVQITCN